MLYDFFSDFFDDDFFSFKPATGMAVNDIVCPVCKMHLSKFLNEGKFGCSNCYDVFGKYTRQVLSNIHTTSEHKGKVCETASKEIKIKKEIETLKAQLSKAIEVQNFEEAAKLRDKINFLEKESE